MPEEIPTPPPALPPVEAVTQPQPWGTWPTIGWSLIILASAFAAQIAATIVVATVLTVRGTKLDPQTLAADGNVVAVCAFASGVVAFGLSLLFAALRKGITVRDYLALRVPTGKQVLHGLLFMILFVAASDGLSLLLGRPIVPDVMFEVYHSTTWAMPLLLAALFITAPFSEEFFFRGFLFRGLQQSRLGAIGTVLLTAALWAGIHLQYDLYGILVIFFLGLFLGFVRHKTGSLWLCIMLHAAMNLIATLELLFILSRTE